MVVQIKSSDELDKTLEGAGDKLVVIDFFAVWCFPCKMIAPRVEELANEMPDVIFLKVDIEECEDITEKYNITSMPTFVFIKGGKVVETFSGANFDKLKSTVQKHK
ncbi:thioredoxin-T [Nomia melanderi]|uniref:thioredoxin-T n=1 Tax=Nomia melanderi TaxID=2448451 RepID=UPI0013045D11|nr:thioredoxin-T [Nomia melanderi]